MSVTAAKGFSASGVAAGLKTSGEPDVALIVNDGPSHTAAAVFTSNRCKANPVLWSEEAIKSGFSSLTTHLFQKGDQYINTDVVFGVKDALIVDFVQKPAGSKAPNGELMNEPFYEVKYDFKLAKAAAAQKAA